MFGSISSKMTEKFGNKQTDKLNNGNAYRLVYFRQLDTIDRQLIIYNIDAVIVSEFYTCMYACTWVFPVLCLTTHQPVV